MRGIFFLKKCVRSSLLLTVPVYSWLFPCIVVYVFCCSTTFFIYNLIVISENLSNFNRYGFTVVITKCYSVEDRHSASGKYNCPSRIPATSLKQAAGNIGLHVNAGKTEFMSFNQRDDISTLNGGPVKLVDKLTCLGSSVSSTENDINTWQTKAWASIDRLSVIWKSDQSD